MSAQHTTISVLAVAWLASHPLLAAAPLLHDAYVWQRAWKEAQVAESLALAKAADIRMVDVLAAEAQWRQGHWEVTRVELDYAALREAGLAVGLAIRAGVFPQSDANATGRLAALAQSVVREAQANGLQPAEVHLDFDCPESKLDAFRAWLAPLRKAVAPVPLTITTLPCWLGHPEAFRQLLRATDGFVLQVHSLERPKAADAPFMICDPAAARRAIRAASALGVPFRVALPTYGYTVAFGRDGKFIGFSAEGNAREWPAGSRAREVRADDAAMAKLVRELTDTPPANCTGIIWYRLPCASDRLNWSWATLTTVMRGETPQPHTQARSQRPSPALIELLIENTGNADDREPRLLTVAWASGTLVASDALGGFVKQSQGKNEIIFKGTPHLRPGERKMVAWLRFDGQEEVIVNATVK